MRPMARFFKSQTVESAESNLLNMDTEGAIESVRIKLAEIRENVMALFAQGQSKLSVIQWNPASRPPW